MCHTMPSLHPPGAATYLVGRERAVPFALPDSGHHTAWGERFYFTRPHSAMKEGVNDFNYCLHTKLTGVNVEV